MTKKLQQPLEHSPKPTRKAQEPLSAFDQWWDTQWNNCPLEGGDEVREWLKKAWDAAVEKVSDEEYGKYNDPSAPKHGW